MSTNAPLTQTQKSTQNEQRPRAYLRRPGPLDLHSSLWAHFSVKNIVICIIAQNMIGNTIKRNEMTT
jgi:hypothetical protein